MKELWVVLGAGPSLSAEQVELVRQAHATGRVGVIAVNNAFQLAPWADVLCAADPAWWNNYKAAHAFEGQKLCPKTVPGIVTWKPSGYALSQNSGLYGMHIAVSRNAPRIVLLGFDMKADGKTHFFGDHPKPLSNPNQRIFQRHLAEFKFWYELLPVINCTPGSALEKFPHGHLEEELACVLRLSPA